MNIGIGISTYKRPEVLEQTLKQMYRFLPPNATLVVVSDADSNPPLRADFTFLHHAGIARVKNKCLELLDKAGCTEIFLFDDDTYPIANFWWGPYIESKEPHLMYNCRLPGKPPGDMQELYRDEQIVSFTNTRGCMIYINREVLAEVGGMDKAYGDAMYEHADWTNRIHNAGLTTHRSMDVPGSDKLIYCLDEKSEVDSSINPYTRPYNVRSNYELYKKSKTSKAFKEYR